jgi:hypothetical protein
MLTEIRPHLNERQWRLLLGAQARALRRGRIGRLARLAVVHPGTVGPGARELNDEVDGEPGSKRTLFVVKKVLPGRSRVALCGMRWEPAGVVEKLVTFRGCGA